MTLHQFFLILWARRKVVVAIFLTTVLTAVIVSFLYPKEYTARATIVLDVKSPDPIAGIVLPGLMSPTYMATQMDIISSDRVARRVVKMLKMDESPAIREQWQEATKGKGSVEVWLAPLLKKNLEVTPSRESNVIEIEFSGADPGFSAAVANAFSESYIKTTVDLRVDSAQKYAEWFAEQRSSQRVTLETAQKTLSKYQQETGIVATTERLDFETQKLNEISTQITLVQSQSADALSKQKFGSADTLPEVIRNPLINQLKADVVRMEYQLKELSGRLGQNHPQYKSAVGELNELKSKLVLETSRISRSIEMAGKLNTLKEIEMLAALKLQQDKVLELKGQRDQINLLLHDVDSAQRGYDAISQRLTQSKLEAQSVQTNISILTPAVAPLEHSKPMIFLNVIVSVLLGGLLALATALLLEFMRPRVRSQKDLKAGVNVPMLVEIGVAFSQRELKKTREMQESQKQENPSKVHLVAVEAG